MAKTTERSHLDSIINNLVARAAMEITAAVRRDIAHQLSSIAAPRSARGGGAAAPKSRKPPSKFHRRSPDQIVRDNDRLLGFIKDHPGLRSEDIQKGIRLPKPDVASGLVALRDSGKIKMKGVKRAATYSAA
jgi:hypothetical protein